MLQGYIIARHKGPYDLPSHIAAQPARRLVIQLQPELGEGGGIQEAGPQLVIRAVEEFPLYKIPPYLFFIGLCPCETPPGYSRSCLSSEINGSRRSFRYNSRP